MGAGPSLGKFLKCMDDDDLSKLIESAYKLEPQRMEKMFALAKLRYYEEAGQQPDAVDASAALNISAALLPPQSVASSSAPAILSEMLQSTPATSTAASTSALTTVAQVPTVATVEVLDASVPSNVKDPMNALWNFEGHHLRELLAAAKNPQNIKSQPPGVRHTDRGGVDSSTGAVTIPQRELDADGYPVMYGSCGRDKRYGRCSVCYFRGLRCNTAHYCACCQRAVCVRPRKYPGEENYKICWNVLHMDQDMIQRVDKKKKRKLHALTAAATATASVRMKNIGTCNNGEGDPDHTDRPNDSLNHSAEDLHRAPSIPTVVADVSGAVDL